LNISILALGSRGDIQPCLYLGSGLGAAGHRVRVATFETFRPLVEGYGLELWPIPGDARGLVVGGEFGRAARKGMNLLGMWNAIRRSYGRLAEDIPSGLVRGLGDADIILNQLPGCLYGFDLAQALGVPVVRIAVIPLARTALTPMIGFPRGLSSLPGFNRLTYRAGEWLVWSAFGPAVNRWRRSELGLKPWGPGGPFRHIEARPVPLVNGFSPHVVARPSDWGGHIHLTGYWFMPRQEEALPRGLREFLDSGPAPAFVGFGSMPLEDPIRTTRIVLEALERSELRGVLHSGWGGLGQGDLPAWAHRVSEVPYASLFPRMTAIVHHGGSGTTAEALRSGVPSVIVPFLFDQFYWGGRVATLGVGPEAIPIRRLTADRLAAALQIAAGDAAVRSRAADLGERIRAEDGVRRAVNVIEAVRRDDRRQPIRSVTV
jgi:UDP:flavonoid glycosyltransferase YjiC (YdhE family)